MDKKMAEGNKGVDLMNEAGTLGESTTLLGNLVSISIGVMASLLVTLVTLYTRGKPKERYHCGRRGYFTRNCRQPFRRQPGSRRTTIRMVNSIMDVNDVGKTPVRLPVRIQTARGNKRVDAMLDTGNTIRTGAAMNAAYCQKIGLAWRRYKRKEPVGTAKKSSQLQVLGETEPFQIHIVGLAGTSGVHMVECTQDGIQDSDLFLDISPELKIPW